MGNSCSTNTYEDLEPEDSEEQFQEIPNMPEPGIISPLENALYAPNHISVYHNQQNPLDGKESFPEIELSPVSDYAD